MTLRLTAVFVIAVLAGPALEGPAVAAPSAKELFEQGKSSFARGDYASAVAKWTDSYSLSKEPELLFNIAQAHRLDGRWSNPATSLTIDCSYANFYNGTAFCVNPPNGAVNRVGSESPKGDGKWGQADLAGNVEEWTLDWLQNPYSNPCDDCANLTPGSRRADRGGYYYYDASFLRTASRVSDPPDTRYPVIGVRCARAP